MKILVLGVGNILYTDEGLGVKTVEWLQQNTKLPDNVTLLDGGTLGNKLLGDITACDELIILDAVLGGDKPGSIYKLTGENLRKSLSFSDSLHQMDLVDTLILCELMGNRPNTIVIGMEPEDYRTLALDLTPTCQANLEKFAQTALEEINKLLDSEK